MATPESAVGLQGSSQATVNNLAGENQGTGPGWQQSKPNLVPSADIGQVARVLDCHTSLDMVFVPFCVWIRRGMQGAGEVRGWIVVRARWRAPLPPALGIRLVKQPTRASVV